ncbi:MAG: 2-amino-4-hydroxy-6-hydroxymethyldihydropteridine diphosphokinase [Chloroflexota bacterium]|nr:2-amino-4-hydroxy-6-hydroxymethyldihydropteridine diphosphokinase [Chloroflexota bacterium]MBI5702807.1 2-amino-4-hydroxy-6-hydroxymethyldihydropteridine diphosphokinase [Chloroflexota bacterium]
MRDLHLAYLNLGSNIQPETNLVRAVELLHAYGKVLKVSNAWESLSVGAEGPNYLNACVLFQTELMQVELKENIIRPIEARLGRRRSENKYAPRTIDIDIVLFDDQPYNDKFWRYAFVIVPLAEIYPDYKNPLLGETLAQTAARLRSQVWMEARPEVLSRFR